MNGECKFSDKVNTYYIFCWKKFLNFLKNKLIYKKCCFAHGKEELKAKINLPENYKTKPCKQYFTQGYCPYGKEFIFFLSRILFKK